MCVYNLRLTFCCVMVLILMGSNLRAQDAVLSGKVINAENNQPVEFANLGVVGTYLGTASDFNGEFSLSVSQEYTDFKVQVSAVGYRPKVLTVNELQMLTPATIKLVPQAYGIGQVDVMAESKQLYGIIKSASNMIRDNYMTGYQANVYFEQIINESKKTEAAINYTDEIGYGDRKYSKAFEKRHFKVAEIRRNYDATPIKDGLILAEDMLEFDIVRVRGNILDVESIDQFELELKDEIIFNKDSVWVISFSLNKPGFIGTGDMRVKAYAGIIYINKKDQAVLRAEIDARSEGPYHAGRAAIMGDNNEPEGYDYHVEIDYRKLNGHYVLSKILYTDFSASLERKMKWIVYDVKALSLNYLKGRDYFMDLQSRPDFWKRFTIPQ